MPSSALKYVFVPTVEKLVGLELAGPGLISSSSLLPSFFPLEIQSSRPRLIVLPPSVGVRLLPPVEAPEFLDAASVGVSAGICKGASLVSGWKY